MSNPPAHGLIFKPQFIVDIDEGRKSRTRRLVTRANSEIGGKRPTQELWDRLDWSTARPLVTGGGWHILTAKGRMYHIFPRIQPGHVIWPKEVWTETDPGAYCYKAACGCEGYPEETQYTRWRSPLHQPRAAARHELPVLTVCAQWLQDISEEDAKAEGAPNSWSSEMGQHVGMPRAWFAQLWDSISPKRPWDSNPPVWVYEWEPPCKS